MPDDVSTVQSKTAYLVVDDNPLFRNLLRTFLAGPDADVIEASNGEDALQAYEQFRPAWVIMDIEMPHLDGFAATRRIKSAYPEARVAIVTQYDQQEYREEASVVGAEVFLPKNNIVHLKETLKRRSQL